MTVTPSTVRDLQQVIKEHASILVMAGGTKSPRASAGDGTTQVNLEALAGVSSYSADECVVTAGAATKVRDLAALLGSSGQYLPFDPPLSAAGATIGGTVAAGVSGPCRYQYGGVRDFVIGARLVDGEGRLIRSGGQVVKNAAGFLLHHGVVGSFGTFGVLTELTFKVFPLPEARATLRVTTANLTAALEAVRRIEGAPTALEAIDVSPDATIWLRIAGRAAALPDRIAALTALVGKTEVLYGEEDARVWADASEFAWAARSASIVKVPVTFPKVAALVAANRWLSDARLSCGVSVAWVASQESLPALSAELAGADLQGVVIRGPEAGRRLGRLGTNVFEERVRRVLDPHDRFRATSHSSR